MRTTFHWDCHSLVSMIKAGRTNQEEIKETFLLNRLFLGSEIIFNFIKKTWILFLFCKPTVYKHDISILLSLHKEKDSSNFFVPGLKGSVGVKKPWQWFLFNVQDRTTSYCCRKAEADWNHSSKTRDRMNTTVQQLCGFTSVPEFVPMFTHGQRWNLALCR